MQKNKIIGATLACALFLGAATPASARIYCPPKVTPAGGGSSAGPWVVGCIGASALGLIVAALAKKTGELTIEEAQAIAFTCGLGFFPVVAKFKQSTPAQAKF
jgi:hypothetical protein